MCSYRHCHVAGDCFGSTYEGLKLGQRARTATNNECFGSTYEGLKQQWLESGEAATVGFGSTYEGLKLGTMHEALQGLTEFWQYL